MRGFSEKEMLYCQWNPFTTRMGTQWLSASVRDSRLKGHGFKPHFRHCVVSLSKTHLSLLRTGLTQEDPSQHD